MDANAKKVLIWIGVAIAVLIIGTVVWNILPKGFRIYTTIGWVLGAAVGSFATSKGYKWWLDNVKKEVKK